MPQISFEPFAETLEPRGESSLVVRRLLAITFAARAVSHAFDSRGLNLDNFPNSPASISIKAIHVKCEQPPEPKLLDADPF
jgi:hypothetical protein